jgi:hypothetical protein
VRARVVSGTFHKKHVLQSPSGTQRAHKKHVLRSPLRTRQAVSGLLHEKFVFPIRGLLKGAITRHGLTESLNGARLLPGTALRKITATYELAKHISYEMLRKNLERLIGLLR